MRLGVISDLHWMAEPPAVSAGWHGTGAEFRGVLARFDEALEMLSDERVDVIALAGDLAHHGDEESIVAVLRRCGDVGVPVLVVSGNHDVAGDPEALARASWRAGVDAVTLASASGDVYGAVRVAGVQVGPTDGWFGAHLGSLPDTDSWGDEPVILISHYPALSLAVEVSGHGFPYPGDLVDRQRLTERLLRRNAPTVVIGGHIHARASRSESNLLQLSSGALVEPPYECAIVEVRRPEDGALTVSRSSRRLLPASGGREPVLAPELQSWRYLATEGWTPTGERLDELAVP